VNLIFDMYTHDPNDVLTLCLVAADPRLRLLGVTEVISTI
jgi:hypothetical protein